MSNERCARCDEPVGTGSPLYAGRVVTTDGRLVCGECALALRGIVRPVSANREAPITMPSTNLPNTH